MSGQQQLPMKEANLFRQIIKFYENKQYKKGIKAADAILKKFPDHGETLAMKGLILNFQDKKEEAYELVRRGLKCDLKSHVSWHVYGLLYRSDRNYEEAIKCYRNALRIDKNNNQILRDLALLEMQIRNFDALIDTRLILLEQRANQRVSWIGMAVAHHVAGNLQLAIDVLDAHESSIEHNEESRYDYELSELYLYKAQLYEEAGRFQEAYDYLEAKKRHIFDDEALQERQVALLIKLGRHADAEKIQRQLLDANPDNGVYYTRLAECLQIAPGDSAKLIELYSELSALYPRAHVPKRALLDLLEGDAFRAHADKYLRSWLSKGAPSLFTMVRKLYADPAKGAVLHSLLDGYLANLRGKPSRFASNDATEQNPTTLLWTLFFAAQHYAQLRDFTRALVLIDEAIAHTPTVVEVHHGKAKILKQAGDVAQAAEVMNQARLLDLQDRFINSKSTKYLLRNDQLQRAEEVVGLFAKGDPGDPGVNNLHAMQCMWYALECSNSHLRQRQWGRALKRLHEVAGHFADITDDQLDFHAYCMRKMTLRAYIGARWVSMIRTEDTLRSHRFYQQAAREAVQLYLQLHDNPKALLSNPIEDELAHLPESERKKALNKLKKAQAKAQAAKEAEPKKEAVAKKGGKVDEDPDGQKLLQTTDPLGEALKFVQPWVTQTPTSAEAHAYAAEVHLRRGKPLLVLKHLKRALQLNPDDAAVHRVLCKVAQTKLAAPAGATRSPAVEAVIAEGLAAVTGGKSAQELNDQYLKRHAAGPFPDALVGAELFVELGGDKSKAAALLAAVPITGARSLVLQQACAKTVTFLASKCGDASGAAAFAKRALEVFPLSPSLQAAAKA